MQKTLFGTTETKSECTERAKRIAELHRAIEEAPVAIACRESDVIRFSYFIERGQQARLDPNDLDGLQRFIGETEDLLTEREQRAMRKRRQFWKKFPDGWLGALPGEEYCAALHAKEIAFLRRMQEESRQEIEAVTTNLKRFEAELANLQNVGPIPEALVRKFSLTTNGFLLHNKNGNDSDSDSE